MTGAGDDYPRPIADAPLADASDAADALAVDDPATRTDVTSAAARDLPLRAALIVGAVSAGIRLVWVIVMSRVPQGLSDLTIYPYAGESIGRGRGYLSILDTPTTYYPPGYPLFLGAVQWVLDRIGLGDHLVFGAGVVQALLGGVTAAAVVVAGHRLAGLRAGIVAGVLVACWPNLVVHSSLMLSESLFLAVFAVLIAAVLVLTPRSGVPARGDGRSPWVAGIPVVPAVVAALAMGLSTLVRPQSAALVLPAVAVAWAVARQGWRAWLARVAVLVLGVVVVVGPWTVRNAVVMDAFVPVSTNTGDNLCIGFHDGASGGFMQPEVCETGEKYVDGPAAEVRRDKENRSTAIRWALDHPTRLIGLSWDKLWLSFRADRDALGALESYGADPFLGDRSRRAMGWVMDGYYYAVLAAAALGTARWAPAAWRDRRSDVAPLVLFAITVATAVVPVLGFGDMRFKVPITPCLALLAAYAVTRRHGPGDPGSEEAEHR